MSTPEQDIANLRVRVSLLERQVKFLLGHTTEQYVDYLDDGFPDVAALRNQGKILEAITLYRQKTGASLIDAKKFVEGM